MTDNDQAAVEALCRITTPDGAGYSIPFVEDARAIIDNIRAGAVPGVCMADTLVALRGAISALESSEKSRADKAEAEAAKCNDLCAEIGGDDPAECLDIVRGDNMAHEGVVKELVKATAERDRLAGLLRECKDDMVNGLTLEAAADLEHRIEAALAEVGKP